MDKQTLLFDLDDTLIHCNKYFDEVVDQFADLIATWFLADGITHEQAKTMQFEIDTAGVHVLGFAAKHFPQSLLKTYEHFSALTGRRMTEAERQQLQQLGDSVYVFPNLEPYPHMEETLTRLQDEGHALYLYSGGEPSIQREKVQRMQLHRYFGERIFISPHKTTETMETILQEQQFVRERTWMIGNSLRTDVVPALESGINAIYVPAILEWQYNIVEVGVTPKHAFVQVTSLQDVPPAIAEHAGMQPVRDQTP